MGTVKYPAISVVVYYLVGFNQVEIDVVLLLQGIEDIRPLSGLTQLTWLELTHGAIDDAGLEAIRQGLLPPSLA